MSKGISVHGHHKRLLERRNKRKHQIAPPPKVKEDGKKSPRIKSLTSSD